jgi:hypothetical protein
MSTFFAFIGASVGGWLGWIVGTHVGLMTAYVLSVVGTAVGVYYGRQAASSLLD